VTENDVLRILVEVVNELGDLNDCRPLSLKETDTPFDGKSGLDSLNALEAESALAERIGLPADSKKLAAIRNPKLPIGEAARQIAEALRT
jgi:acyl carrier protein